MTDGAYFETNPYWPDAYADLLTELWNTRRSELFSVIFLVAGAAPLAACSLRA